MNIFATFINLSSDRVFQRALKIVMHEMINGAFEKNKKKNFNKLLMHIWKKLAQLNQHNEDFHLITTAIPWVCRVLVCYAPWW